jgi:malate dehydrogenase (oxaloacetate-decarboxylating)
VAISGAGAAGIAVARLLRSVGVADMVVCDRAGIISGQRSEPLNAGKRWLAENTNATGMTGQLADAIDGADVFIGVSAANVLTAGDLVRMNSDPIVFALANPDPEIRPEDALPIVRVMATGRSDYPNQINNVLCFPGFFRGMLDVRAARVTERMKLAAAEAIANVIPQGSLHPDYIIPSVFDRRVAKVVSEAVSAAAEADGVARRQQKSGTQGPVEK